MPIFSKSNEVKSLDQSNDLKNWVSWQGLFSWKIVTCDQALPISLPSTHDFFHPFPKHRACSQAKKIEALGEFMRESYQLLVDVNKYHTNQLRWHIPRSYISILSFDPNNSYFVIHEMAITCI